MRLPNSITPTSGRSLSLGQARASLSAAQSSASGSSADSAGAAHSDASKENPEDEPKNSAPGSPVIQPAVPPPGVRTRLRKGIRHPKKYTDGTVRYGMLSSTGEPLTLTEAPNDAKWHEAMHEEYNALIQNKTWHLVPPKQQQEYY
jgi:hypothetical protein